MILGDEVQLGQTTQKLDLTRIAPISGSCRSDIPISRVLKVRRRVIPWSTLGRRLPIAVLISGGGTTLRNLIEKDSQETAG